MIAMKMQFATTPGEDSIVNACTVLKIHFWMIMSGRAKTVSRAQNQIAITKEIAVMTMTETKFVLAEETFMALLVIWMVKF